MGLHLVFGVLFGESGYLWSPVDPLHLDEFEPECSSVLPTNDQKGVILPINNFSLTGRKALNACRDSEEAFVLSDHTYTKSVHKTPQVSDRAYHLSLSC